MYGFAIIFWFFEVNLPGSIYDVKFLGAPAAFYYGGLFMLIAVNIFLAWLWCYVPEQVDKKKEMEIEKGGRASGLSG